MFSKSVRTTNVRPAHMSQVSLSRARASFTMNMRTSQRTQLDTVWPAVRHSGTKPATRWRATPQLSPGQTWEERYGEPLSFGVSSQQGEREEMEDVAAIVPKGVSGYFFAGVFDGHAGVKASQYLAENLYSSITRALQQDGFGEDPPAPEFSELLSKVFQEVDHSLLERLERPGKAPSDAGSTATCVLVRREKLHVANVGDSRAVLSRGGKATDLTTEHRAYGKGDIVKQEKKRIESVGGWVKNGRVCDMLAVTRAFGDADFKGDTNRKRMLEEGVREGYWSEDFASKVNFTGDPVIATPDVATVPLESHDEFIIIASDGLWDVYSSSEAVSLLRRGFMNGNTAQEMADLLVERAIQRRTQDNVVVVVVIIGDPETSRAAGTVKSKKQGLFSGWLK
uniref:protein-serine/threonine phosphatase n=1 Tax=Tetraselmis sp. GSL018 TaxID=582737 RepID=A0A061SL87_9CHLO